MSATYSAGLLAEREYMREYIHKNASKFLKGYINNVKKDATQSTLNNTVLRIPLSGLHRKEHTASWVKKPSPGHLNLVTESP